MTIAVPTLTAEIAHDASENLIGTLAPTGGVGPYEVVAIWPAAGAVPDGVVLSLVAWRGREDLSAAEWRERTTVDAAAWRGRITLPETTWR